MYALEEMPKSSFHAAQIEERKSFVASEVRRPEQYSQPPNSVIVDRTTEIASLTAHDAQKTLAQPESVVYSVGMRYIRSDPYTGMAMLYEYLYAGGPYSHTRNLVLQDLPEMASTDLWQMFLRRGEDDFFESSIARLISAHLAH